MFESTFVPEKSERTHTVAFALLLQTIAVAGLAIAPLLSIAAIEVTRITTIVDPLRALPKPVPQDVSRQVQPRTAARSTFRVAALPSLSHPFAAPRVIQSLMPGDPLPFTGAPAYTAAPGIPGGDLIGSTFPIPMKVPKPETPKVVHLTSALSQSQLLFAPKPEYPRMAMLSRTEGVVRLQAIIGKDGTIQRLHVVEGSPLLTEAALTAVRQWRYRPLLLNGQTLEVSTEIEVRFTLGH